MTDTMGAAIDRFKSQQRAERETMLRAIGDIGKASGLEAGAKVLRALADHRRRVVGTSELKAAAEALEQAAEDIRAKANSQIAAAK